MNLDSIDNKYLEMSDGDIDKLLMGLDLDSDDKEEENWVHYWSKKRSNCSTKNARLH